MDPSPASSPEETPSRPPDAAARDARRDDVVITVRDLVTHYGDRQILKSVSLDVHAGEILVIMGGSGSGKSTLLNHLLGLLRPTSGVVEVLGKNINTSRESELTEIRRKFGVAFQGGALFSSMTLLENIMLPLYEHTDLDRRTMEIMARMKMEVVSLSGFDDLMPAELSGGMIKRAALARAIVMDPRILFCDEPSAGLDPVVAAAIDDLILDLRDATGMSVVVVTHELESAFKIADRICVLDKGKVLTIAPVEEVRANPDQRIQNLLNRRTEEEELDPEAYLRRLTGEKEP
ncbi:ABC transporter ATP-binding protein [Caenispirillum salinarum]|uniref:ABC transporter ATP-binding protein n=1 Tax=Caenispirillum salinarum TaxID=859058 RepID=UPI00384CCAFB